MVLISEQAEISLSTQHGDLRLLQGANMIVIDFDFAEMFLERLRIAIDDARKERENAG